ncbi:MAG: hypothetical protein HN368_02250 [Spirochaetales bacterium]|mgnify:CR=1 FL=1|nr:hypothetical protein [Spirochaetales bacterium]
MKKNIVSIVVAMLVVLGCTQEETSKVEGPKRVEGVGVYRNRENGAAGKTGIITTTETIDRVFVPPKK